jgi:hypothetical protein
MHRIPRHTPLPTLFATLSVAAATRSASAPAAAAPDALMSAKGEERRGGVKVTVLATFFGD